MVVVLGLFVGIVVFVSVRCFALICFFGDLLWFMICLMFGGILFWCLFDTLRFGLIVCGY